MTGEEYKNAVLLCAAEDLLARLCFQCGLSDEVNYRIGKLQDAVDAFEKKEEEA